MEQKKLLLGIDIGTSSIKVSVVDADTQRPVAAATCPEHTERPILSPKPGWAEQDPELWWQDVQSAVLKTQKGGKYNPKDIIAIGITYQMHGLVLINNKNEPIRHAIIWCDSRTEKQAKMGVETIGVEKCQHHLLNFPGNFTASKLAWVKENEPKIYATTYKMMLPGDFIAMKLTNTISATPSMLSEGIFWDFKTKTVSEDILNCYNFNTSILPEIKPVFGQHGYVTPKAAQFLNIPAGIPITYKAGDQLNNALSLNVLQPGEVATTAGTSGVIYAVTDRLVYDKKSRINTFAHVNYNQENNCLGVLLCLNGTGISNRWIRDRLNPELSYSDINQIAKSIPPGAEGLLFLPFGNGAERIFGNKQIGASFSQINLNIHSNGHMYRAVQEGIAFSFRYGLDIMRENGLQINVIKAGKANMFLSDVFIEAFVNITGLTLELYHTDGSVGAALGAGIGLGFYKNERDAFSQLQHVAKISPDPSLQHTYELLYKKWKDLLKPYH